MKNQFTENLLLGREWINAERMRRACACLMAGRNVQETSGDVGYESQHGFSLAFKKFFGYPPSLHRETMENGKWKSKVEGRRSKASEGRAWHSVRAEPPQYAKSEIGNRKSEIGNRKSEIGNRKSEIGNRKSEIGNHISWSQIRF